MERTQLAAEFQGLTEAVINTVRSGSFEYLKTFLSSSCKTRLEQGIRLSDIMAAFDLYETALKDAMTLYLGEDLVVLNTMRREIDTLLDRARVFVSECFFLLYEETVFKQFEQLRVINEISSHMVSSLDLDRVLGFIVSNALRLFKARCGCVSLANTGGDFITEISHGWRDPNSPKLIARCSYPISDIIIASAHDGNISCLQDVIGIEGLKKLVVLKLRTQNRVIGLLSVGIHDERKFISSEIGVLTTFANSAAMAVNNAQLYADTDQKLQERVRETTVLLEQNRALLHSMREGVIAINNAGYITLVNHEALRSINMASDPVGRHIKEVIPNSRLPVVVKRGQAEYDQEQVLGGKAVITNRVPVIANGKVTGAIATFRDKEDVKQLAEELIGVKSLLESMRAQSHEFINKLHAISGLIQMGQYDKVVELITQIYQAKQELISHIVERVHDKATAGLLLGKVSQAQEKGVVLKISQRSKLTKLPPHFSSTSMVTVLGNLITNAIEAVSGLEADRRYTEVRIGAGRKHLIMEVDDRGCGIPRDHLRQIFKRGFSTKQGGRGIGLALVREEVEASGGRISVRSVVGQGSRFTVKIPLISNIV